MSSLTFDALYPVIHRGGLSGRAAAFVIRTLLQSHGIADKKGWGKAAEHTAEHGPQGSAAAQAVLLKLQRHSRPQLEEWARLANELVAAQDSAWHAQYEAEQKSKALDAWLLNPLTAAERTAAESAALDKWWREEGRAECELEERGESKYYYHERDKAALEGRDLTPAAYLAGETANSDDES